MSNRAIEHVVLLDANHQQIGIMDKSQVHTAHTPLHLAFSCYVFNADGQLLVTRRATSKVAWPGVWTNSVCGHPQQGEAMADAVRRRCLYEMGLPVEEVELVTDNFQYREVDASGIVENEYCPIFRAFSDATPAPRASEVMDYQWVDLEALYQGADAAPWAFSPWMVKQLALLRTLEHFTPATQPVQVG
ncbi:isopentenyl-diphosphate Delta-isomerase [Nissabacter sp. SGAir0207]|uniref:isopentenyl-diphosphate Delta-isomerase n=1 Tax=Nissabacter sp. SGAir0207 TaxID=2126321 RepID=UPI0010CCB879|nr:isopentenyl-diphosphate Delta-isomerase [Nissabacter sp. SGAir0207]QCR36088.1 isopentenyl-diphosphate delta-isomerase [Nissabacter sp. SGAir0207]